MQLELNKPTDQLIAWRAQGYGLIVSVIKRELIWEPGTGISCNRAPYYCLPCPLRKSQVESIIEEIFFSINALSVITSEKENPRTNGLPRYVIFNNTGGTPASMVRSAGKKLSLELSFTLSNSNSSLNIRSKSTRSLRCLADTLGIGPRMVSCSLFSLE